MGLYTEFWNNLIKKDRSEQLGMELHGTRNGAMRFFASCFFMNHLSPKALKNNNSAIEIFCENSRRYSQLKVHRRWSTCHQCRWHRWWTLTYEYLRQYFENLSIWRYWRYQGLRGRWLMTKSRSKKSRDTVPFKGQCRGVKHWGWKERQT